MSDYEIALDHGKRAIARNATPQKVRGFAARSASWTSPEPNCEAIVASLKRGYVVTIRANDTGGITARAARNNSIVTTRDFDVAKALHRLEAKVHGIVIGSWAGEHVN